MGGNPLPTGEFHFADGGATGIRAGEGAEIMKTDQALGGLIHQVQVKPTGKVEDEAAQARVIGG